MISIIGGWMAHSANSFYNGDVPVIVVKDLDFLQYVFVKSSSNFTDRGVTIRSDEMHPYLSHCLVHAKGTHWKNTRQSVSSGFTSSKIKQMMGHIAEMCDVFMDVLGGDADNGTEVHMVSKFQGLTMDYLGRAAFGIDASFQRNLNHPFLITAKEAAHGLMTGPIHMLARTYKIRTLRFEEVVMNTTLLFLAGFSTRQATEDFEYKGIKYRAGTCIMAPTLQIHRDARFFADPMKFDPDR
ncbi:hypothetical protein HPB47_022748 [Ixodes persulcatus]|uniref:Uncharacterized protein n=1 Tax=Ixodes persulcatus TaxID=34615 RepID=A0AC60QB57_IXOPE|nr:hypothetical protein HPB47_022748 [Ixodes persulcatus]